MSCEHCENGELTRNLIPQVGFEMRNGNIVPEAYVLAKTIIDVGGEPHLVELHMDINPKDGRKKHEPIGIGLMTRMEYCPICGGKLTEVTDI